jgi:hypothetical protein
LTDFGSEHKEGDRMSAFVMVLAAGMAVGSGPEPVSAEVKPPLDLRGEWEGTLEHFDGQEARLVRGAVNPQYVDEGDGKFRLRVRGRASVCLGIYRQEGDRVILCFGRPGEERPTSFQGGHGQEPIILHRVKPDK